MLAIARLATCVVAIPLAAGLGGCDGAAAIAMNPAVQTQIMTSAAATAAGHILATIFDMLIQPARADALPPEVRTACSGMAKTASGDLIAPASCQKAARSAASADVAVAAQGIMFDCSTRETQDECRSRVERDIVAKATRTTQVARATQFASTWIVCSGQLRDSSRIYDLSEIATVTDTCMIDKGFGVEIAAVHDKGLA